MTGKRRGVFGDPSCKALLGRHKSTCTTTRLYVHLLCGWMSAFLVLMQRKTRTELAVLLEPNRPKSVYIVWKIRNHSGISYGWRSTGQLVKSSLCSLPSCRQA